MNTKNVLFLFSALTCWTALSTDARCEDADSKQQKQQKQHSGIHLFAQENKRPFRGAIVPDGLKLPKGYSRYYRRKDDGTPLPPVLVTKNADGKQVVLDKIPDEVIAYQAIEK